MRTLNDRRRWWILLAMTASLSMVYIDITILPVTLPTLSRELGFSPLGLQWIINAYTLALTVLALAGGKLAHTLGLKTSFQVGLTIFAGASALCGLSSTEAWMIAARVLQGAGAALMIPSQNAIMLGTFPPQQRGKAIGLLVSISSIFLIIGPFIGGTLTEFLGWRYIFWINLPIAATGMLLTFLIVPHFEKVIESFDWFGFFTVGSGVASIVIATMHGQSWGWLSPFTLLLFLAGILLITFFCKAEQKAPHPLVDLVELRKRSFLGGSLTTFCASFIVMVMVFWTIFLQNILDYSPSQTGLLLLVGSSPVLFIAPLAGYLTDRLGPRFPITAGFILMGISILLFSLTASQENLWVVLGCLSLFGISTPLIFTPSLVALMEEIPPEKRGVASGMNTTFRQFGSTMGLAVFGSLFYQWHFSRFSHSLAKNLPTEKLDPSPFEGLLSQKPSALQHLHALPADTASFVQESMISSFVSAFHLINFFGALCALVGLWIAMRFLGRSAVKKEPAKRQKWDEDEIVQAMFANTHLQMTYFAKYLPTMEIVFEPDVTVVRSKIEDDTFNYVLGAQFTETNAQGRIEHVRSLFQEFHLPFSWWVSELDSPASLAEHLLRQGFTLKEKNVGMYLELARFSETNAPSLLNFQRVESQPHLKAFSEVIASVGGSPRAYDVIYSQLPQAVYAGNTSVELYLAYFDNIPIVTGMLVTHANVAGIYYVATTPIYRKRGFGTAMMQHLLQRAKTKGCFIATLQASHEGLSLYEKMGFKACANFFEYAP